MKKILSLFLIIFLLSSFSVGTIIVFEENNSSTKLQSSSITIDLYQNLKLDDLSTPTSSENIFDESQIKFVSLSEKLEINDNGIQSIHSIVDVIVYNVNASVDRIFNNQKLKQSKSNNLEKSFISDLLFDKHGELTNDQIISSDVEQIFLVDHSVDVLTPFTQEEFFSESNPITLLLLVPLSTFILFPRSFVARELHLESSIS